MNSTVLKRSSLLKKRQELQKQKRSKKIEKEHDAQRLKYEQFLKEEAEDSLSELPVSMSRQEMNLDKRLKIATPAALQEKLKKIYPNRVFTLHQLNQYLRRSYPSIRSMPSYPEMLHARHLIQPELSKQSVYLLLTAELALDEAVRIIESEGY